MAVKTGTTTFGEGEAQKYGFDINNYSKDSWTVGYTSNYTMAVWQGFDAIDGPTKFMTQDDTQKTQALYRINMQNIVRIHPPKGFSVPGNVGSINGGVKVISESERRQIEEENKRNQEEKDKRNDSDSDNSRNDSNSNDSNTSIIRNQNGSSNSNTTTRGNTTGTTTSRTTGTTTNRNRTNS